MNKDNIFEDLFSLKGKTALVTGGYRGIGLVFSETYAEAGADIAIVARTLDKCQEAARNISEKYGVKAIGKSMDVRDSAMVEKVIKEIIDEMGKIDILVNSAGVSGQEKSIMEMSDEDMDDVMNIDFRGTFVVCRAVAKHMAERQSGKIINIASILGKIAARYMAPYCSSKGAVIQFTRVLALELMRYNVQVNVLNPGYFLTDFNRDFFESEAGKKLIKKMIPMNRVGDVEELRSTALYLATCPSFMTGAEIVVDGGHSIV